MKTKRQYRKALAEGIRICQELRQHGNTNYYHTDLLFQTDIVKRDPRYQAILHKIHLAE